MKKTLILIVAIVASIISLSSFNSEGNESKVILVINKADWCSICKANGERVGGVFGKNNADGFFKLVWNDITNDQTKEKYLKGLQNEGLDKIHANVIASGLMTFYDAKTKKMLAQVTVANSDEELTFVMNKVREPSK